MIGLQYRSFAVITPYILAYISVKSLSELNNEQNIEDLNVRELKEILVANFVDYKGCLEKNELIEKVRRLYRDRQNEKIKGKTLMN